MEYFYGVSLLNIFLGKRESVQSLELSFPVTTTHFHNNKVRLKCLATIAGTSMTALQYSGLLHICCIFSGIKILKVKKY